LRIRLAAFALFLSTTVFAQVDPDLLSGLKARSIGPATMSGRVAAVEAVESNPNIVYVGAATGGVWKSTNGGTTWSPIFDDQPVHAIGAIGIFQPNPDIVWVGTGEANLRNSVSYGAGVYKSIDGGRTWRSMGLEKTERIYRIVTHPTNPDVVWVAATGALWGDSAERGVFKTEDGGRSWKKVLYVNESTGAADLIIDPSNPNKLFAAMWQFRRWPWFFHSGGAGSGLHVTHDGGATWKKYSEDDGLPKGQLGRIGLAISRSNPQIVYAIVEADKSAVIRSDDGGRRWRKVNEESDVANRPFYYAELRVDPKDPNRVYNIYSLISVSNDGAKSFEVLVPFAKVHPDHHAFWIDPNDPNRIYNGNDGGVAESRDRGRTWRFVGNLPLGQYYHISVDNLRPYNVYGGMQDNGSWRGPSAVWENGGIRNHHWQEVGFGDGFATVPDPNDPTTGYSMSQEGFLSRWDVKTGERKSVRPAHPGGTDLRFNWNAAIAVDPFDPATIYYGSQFVHKSTNRGDAWTIISPDLTTNDPKWQHQRKSGGITLDVTGAENFETIMTIAPSAVQRGVIWAGTDDGRIQVTRDGGATWTSVEANLKGVPANTWVPHIEPSKFDAGTAFAVFDNHRRSDFKPYVMKTTDYGKTWTSLVTPDLKGYALVLEQDPVAQDLLFLGTELGLFISLDGGKKWLPFRHGLQTASVMALIVHPREHDLVIGTHGRSAWIIDDIRPLRTLSAQAMAKPLHVFEVADAQQYRVSQTGGERFPGDVEFRGENRRYGALITFALNQPNLPHPLEEKERERKEKIRETTAVARPLTDVPPDAMPVDAEKKAAEDKPRADIEVADATGKVIRKFKANVVQGLNRAAWDLRRDAFKEPPRTDRTPEEEEARTGPEVLPGAYTVTVKYGGQEAKTTVNVLGDPRFNVSAADRQANFNALLRAGALQEAIGTAVERIQRVRGEIDLAAKADPKTGTELKRRLDQMEQRLWVPPKAKGIVRRDDALSRVGLASGSLASYYSAPTQASLLYLEQATKHLETVLADFNKLFAEDVAKWRAETRAAEKALEPIKVN
jgi:photosystem II stability/assembly factor-like uncharacterized protein